MDCQICPIGKRILCFTACPEVNAQLCKIDNEIREDAMNDWGKGWTPPGTRIQRRCNFIGWTVLLIIVGVAAVRCDFQPLPSNLDSLVVSPRALERLHKEAVK